MKQRLCSALLALVMLLGLVPAMGTTASAAETDTRKVITRVEGEVCYPDDPDYQLRYGKQNTYNTLPTIKFTKAIINDAEVTEGLDKILQMSDTSLSWWRRYDEDTNTWKRYDEIGKNRGGSGHYFFEDGKYRFYTLICLGSDAGRSDGSHAEKEYKFADNVVIVLKDKNGDEVWKTGATAGFFNEISADQREVFERPASRDRRVAVCSPTYTVETGGSLLNLGPIQYGVRFYVNESQVGKSIEGPELGIYVAGGKKPYTFTKTQGPAWLDVDPETGKISGTPTAATLGDPTSYPVNNESLLVTVTDSTLPANTANTLGFLIPVGKTYQAADADSRKAIREIKATLTGEAVPVWEGGIKITPVFRVDEIRLTDGTTLDPSTAQFDTGSYCYWYYQKSDGSWAIYPNDAFGEDSGPHRYQYRLRLRLLDTRSTGVSGKNYGEEYKFAENFNLIVTNGDTYGVNGSKKVYGTTAVGEWCRINLVNKNTEPYAEVWSPVYEVRYPGYEYSNELEGKVRFTSDVRVGARTSVEVTDSTAPRGNLQYKWQYKKPGHAWQDCVNGNRRTYMPLDSMLGCKLRVVVRAAGYDFDLVSEERTIEKGVRTTLHEPDVAYIPGKVGASETIATRDRIIIFTSAGQEYVLKTSIGDPTASGFWEGADYNDNPLGQLRYFQDKGAFELNKTYYVYTRNRETSTYEVGKTYKYTAVYTGDAGDTKYLQKVTLKDPSTSKEYADYGVGNTIYLKSGEETTLTVTGSPDNANKWNNIYFREPSGSAGITVKVDGTAGNTLNASPTGGSPFGSHTIKITATSSGTLIASALPSGGEGTIYGRWKVVVYDGDPSSVGLLNVEFVDLPEYSDVTLDVGDTYTPVAGTPSIGSIKTNPDGALTGYRPEWRIGTSAGVSGGWDYSKTDNDHIEVDPTTGMVTAKKKHAEGSNTQLALCLVKDGSSAWPIAYYCVTVKGEAAPQGALLVNPGSLSVKMGEGSSLTAQATALPAEAVGGSFNWSSSDPAIATVIATGSQAEVTAHNHGDTTIKVTYTYTLSGESKELSAEVLVSVHRWGAWTELDETTHRRGCTESECSAMENADHEPELDGSTWRCRDCGYTWQNAGRSVLLDANGGTVVSAFALLDQLSGKPDFLPTPERSGYSFEGWYTAPTGGTRVTGDTAVEESVSTLYAHWAYLGGDPAAHTVTVRTAKNGSVTADRKTAAAGSIVTLTVTPDKGYTLETLTVLDKSGKQLQLTEKNGRYTFAMPAGAVTVTATFMESNAMLNFFADVKPGDYFYDAVLWAAEKGITGGTDATHFTPSGVCTRAQAVTFLWRAAGSPAPKSTSMPFTDVPKGSYYEQAVLWAVENGITKGISDTTFGPNAACSRAQIVTFLWRSQKSPAAGSANPFTDVPANAYYIDAVRWAVKEHITSGTTAAAFTPDANCTRAQIVTFLYRALAEKA